MKRFLVAFLAFFLLVLSCDTGTNKPSEPIPEEPGTIPEAPGEPGEKPIVEPEPVNPENPIDPLPEEVEDDARLVAFGAKSVKWLRRPVTSRGVVFNIADGDPVAAYCTEPGWAYIFYDDMAVIGYEPFPDAVSVMHEAVIKTVEDHNNQYPALEWYYINVAIPGPPPPVVSNDPMLDVWQYALCADDGTIVDGPYTAEFDFNWAAFKSGGAELQLFLYNRDHAPIVAHIVWGPDA